MSPEPMLLSQSVAIAALAEVGVDAFTDDRGNRALSWHISPLATPPVIHRAITLGQIAAGLPTETFDQWATKARENRRTQRWIDEWVCGQP